MTFNIRSILTFILISLSSVCQADIWLQDTNGHKTPLSSLKGKWVFINYWAGWCRTCVDEIPELNRFYQNHSKDPIALYAVNFDELPLSEQKTLIKRLNIRYPSLVKDPAQDLGIGDIIGLPVTFIFNPKGTLVKTLYGGQTVQTLNQVLAKYS